MAKYLAGDSTSDPNSPHSKRPASDLPGSPCTARRRRRVGPRRSTRVRCARNGIPGGPPRCSRGRSGSARTGLEGRRRRVRLRRRGSRRTHCCSHRFDSAARHRRRNHRDTSPPFRPAPRRSPRRAHHSERSRRPPRPLAPSDGILRPRPPSAPVRQTADRPSRPSLLAPLARRALDGTRRSARRFSWRACGADHICYGPIPQLLCLAGPRGAWTIPLPGW